MKEFSGFLFSKLAKLGSKSEGPQYFLQQFDRSVHPIVDKVIPVHKETSPWKEDPVLQEHLATEVIIRGTLDGGNLYYQAIHPVHELATVP